MSSDRLFSLLETRELAITRLAVQLLGKAPDRKLLSADASTDPSIGEDHYRVYYDGEPLLSCSFSRFSALDEPLYVKDLRPKILGKPMHPDHPFWRTAT